VDVALLKTFVELSRSRHFGKTAKALFLTQSAVSARIKALEQSVGVCLLSRDRNNIHLTAAGQKFLVYAERMLLLWNQARHDTALQEENKEFLVLGALPSIWDTTLQDNLLMWRKERPQLALQVEVHGRDTLLKLLHEGILDAAFVFDLPIRGSFKVQELNQLQLRLYSTLPDLPAAELVAREDYIYVDWGEAFRSQHLQMFTQAPPAMLQVSHGRLAHNLLNQQGGSAYLSLTPDRANGLTLVEEAPVMQRDCYALYRTDCANVALLEWMMSTL